MKKSDLSGCALSSLSGQRKKVSKRIIIRSKKAREKNTTGENIAQEI